MADIDELHAQSVQGDLDRVTPWITKILRGAAGFISPPADSPGAAAVAGIRSLLPGRGNFQQEFDRYNAEAAPSWLYSPDKRWGSQVKNPDDPLGRSDADQNRSDAVALEGAFAGMLASHGSPSIWTPEPGAPLGQFRRAYKHSGEGSAYRGAGGYIAQAPEVTETYRERAPWTITIDGKEADVVTRGPGPFKGSVIRTANPTAADEVARELRKRLHDDQLTQEHIRAGFLPSYLRAIGAEMSDAVMSASENLEAAKRNPETYRRLAAMDLIDAGDAGRGPRYGSMHSAMMAADPVAMYQREYDKLAAHLKLINELRNDPSRIDLKKGGSYYTLDFPDKLTPNVLDLELGMRQQTPQVQDAFDRLFQTPTVLDTVTRQRYGKKMISDALDAQIKKDPKLPISQLELPDISQIPVDPKLREQVYWDLANQTPSFYLSKSKRHATDSGWHYYEALSNFLRMEGSNSPELASRALNEAGIPAQKFRDRFSRQSGIEGSPTDTRNFVVFDPDKTLTTLGKHGSLGEMQDFQEALTKALSTGQIPPRQYGENTARSIQYAIDLLRGQK